MKTITATFQRGAEPPFTATGTFNMIPGMGDVVWQNVPDELKHAARTKNYAEGFEHSQCRGLGQPRALVDGRKACRPDVVQRLQNLQDLQRGAGAPRRGAGRQAPAGR